MKIPIYSRERTICAEDTDELDHVNNIVWLRFVVALAHAHAAAVGIAAEAHERMGVAWVVRRHEIEYLRSAVLGERILESTWVTELRGARCRRAFAFRRVTNGETLVRAESLWAFVDRKTQRPRRMPAEILDRFAVVAS